MRPDSTSLATAIPSPATCGSSASMPGGSPATWPVIAPDTLRYARDISARRAPGSSRRPTPRGTAARRNSSKSLTDQVYESLKDDILRAHRAPGDLLLEPELVEDYHVSKTPIREALRLLIQEDWVIVMPRKGHLAPRLHLEAW